VKAYRQALRAKPDYAGPLTNLGMLYYSMGSYQEATSVLKRELKRNPHYAMAYYSLGIVSAETKDKESALTACEKLLELDPKLAQELMTIIDRM
jgi:tetratricopeptide (TPR) repeat protein